MNQKLPAIFVSILAGFLVALIIQFNAALGKFIGVFESAFLAHAIGTVLAFFIIFRAFGKKFVNNISSTPKYLFIGGILGITNVIVTNLVVPILGMVVTISLLIIAELSFCTLADHLGFFGLSRFPITRRRVIGLLLTVAGLILVFYT